jgi:ABC-type tungstate transport system permease subunit
MAVNLEVIWVRRQAKNSEKQKYFLHRARRAKNTGPAKVFADWLVSPEGQRAIGAYQMNGQKLFNPSANSPK